MSVEKEKDRDTMHRFTQGRDSGMDSRLEETEAMLTNTRAFLDGLAESRENTRRYVEQLKETLENDMRRFKRDLQGPREKDD